MSTVDVIIPTYKPDYSLFTLIDDLEKQSLCPSRIIIMNTEEKYWSELTANNPENPLDNTTIHPESYSATFKLLDKLNYSVNDIGLKSMKFDNIFCRCISYS